MSSLLDQPPFTAAELVDLDGRLARLMDTPNDIVVVQAEAIVTLEAVARGIAAPGSTAVNVVSGPYGALFGNWMSAAGATVIDIVTDFDRVVTAAEVEAVLDAAPEASILALVHAEAATGGSNPVAEIARLAAHRGILMVLDAVASIGAEPVNITEWGVDITVIGAQKSLAGPAGISAAAISPRAWGVIEANPSAPRASFLSLLDLRALWLNSDRTAIPGTPNSLESRALLLALDRIGTGNGVATGQGLATRDGVGTGEGLDAVIDRHTRAARATRAALAPLGLSPWQKGPSGFAPVVTAVRIPETVFDESLAIGGIISRGNGALAGALVRVNHTGRSATLSHVLGAIDRLAAAVHATTSAHHHARSAAEAAWQQP